MWESVLDITWPTVCRAFPFTAHKAYRGLSNGIFCIVTPITLHPLIPMLSELHHRIRRKKPVEIDYGIIAIHAVMGEIPFSSFDSLWTESAR